MNTMNTSPKGKAGPRIPPGTQVIIWIVLVALLVLIALGLRKANTPIIAIDSQVPEFSLELFDDYQHEGKSILSLASLRGNIVVINFWASWCKPCESEAADLEAAWQIYRPAGNVTFVGIDYVDTEPEALSYLAKFDITYPNGPDKGTNISQLFNRNLGVPETYFLDRDAVLRYIKIGPFSSVNEIITIIESIDDGGQE
jgi:cytochrome c biogenesis protein CcmG/thiol:disulfide interchange protein DsbE